MHPRSVRITRRSIFGLIILLLLAVLFNLLWGWRKRTSVEKKAPRILEPELKRSAEGFQRSDYDKWGVPRFEIRAARVRETHENKSFLEDIEVVTFNPDGSIRNTIRSQNAEFDGERKLVDFSGNIQMELGGKVTLKSNSLHYDLNTNVGTTPDLMQIQSRELNGSVRGAQFDEKKRSLDFQGEVNLVLNQYGKDMDGTGDIQTFHVTSDRGRYSKLSNLILFEGKARIESRSGVLTADTIKGIFRQDRNNLDSLAAAGDANYEYKDENETGTLSGDRMDFIIGKASVLEKILVFGNAAYHSVTPSEEKTLKGAEIDLEFDSAHELLTQIQGRLGVRFQMNKGVEQAAISGEQLTAKFASVKKPLSNLRVWKQAKLSLEGSEKSSAGLVEAEDIRMRFSNEGEFLESGQATGNVIMTQRTDGQVELRQMRRLAADAVQFHFFPGNFRLIKDLNAEGNVRITYDKNPGSGENSVIHTASDVMSAVFALRNNSSIVQSVLQKGNVSYQKASMSATAGKCEYDAAKDLLILTESPRISNKLDISTGERVEYSPKRKILSIYHDVRSILLSTENENSFFGSGTSSSPVVVTADNMEYREEKDDFQYSGNVRLFSEDHQLRARTLDIVRGGEGIEANEDVIHTISASVASSRSRSKESRDSQSTPTIIQCSKLEYSKENEDLTYQGNVRLSSDNINLSSERLDAFRDPDNNKVKRITLHKNVFIRRNSIQCWGDDAEWRFDSGIIEVNGNPVRISDPAHGARSSPRRLTWSTEDDTIQLDK